TTIYGGLSGYSYQEPLAGTFTLGFDVSGDGTVSGTETMSMIFDEMPALGESDIEHLRSTAMTLQTGLQGLGGALSDVKVDAINPHEYLIHFGDASQGRDMPELTVEDFQFTTGFLPAVMVSTVSEPFELGPIPVSPDNPAATALGIEQAFSQTARNVPIGPIDFPPPNRVPDTSDHDLTQGPYLAPQVMRTALPEVSVRARSATEFDITFVGDAGKKDHQPMVISMVANEYGVTLHDRDDPAYQSTEIDVTTLKEPSAEFRVNPIEHDNPITILPDLYNQTSPSVAMDSDGEFVITWQSEVPNWQNYGSVSDIYARRFTVNGLVDPSVFVPGQIVPGVRAKATAAAVDTQLITFDAQGTPPLSGPFQLQIGDHTTGTIQLDSDDLPGTAAAIEAELLDAGYEGVTVSVRSTTDPYQFRVRFGNESSGIDHPPITYVPVLNPVSGLPMVAATVTVEDESDDLYTFRVNQMTSNAQYDPAVGMDDAGNFVIAWANEGQDISFFNGISAQRFNRHGQRLGNEFQVNVEDTAIHYDPFVAMSSDGHTAITWSRTSDPDYLIPDGIVVSVQASIYAPDGTLLQNVAPGGAAESTAAFDMNNNVVFAWEENGDNDNNGQGSEGVYARMYRLYDATGAFDFAEIRPEFRVNSADLDPASNTLWPGGQLRPQAALDADGDLVIVYDGYGPDVSEYVYPSAYDLTGTFDAYLAEQINADKNADLLQFYDPSFDSFYGTSSAGSVDSAIEEILIQSRTFYGATDQQLGRLRAILDDAAGLLRGEAWGALFSRWDADPQNGVMNTLFSDSVANAMRDGHNTRFFIALDESITGGDFTMRFYTSYLTDGVTGWEDATAAIDLINNTTMIDVYDTADNIENALQALNRTGVNWPEGNNTLNYGSVEVRPVDSFEIADRIGTPWDLTLLSDYLGTGLGGIQETDYVWEVTFQGELHDNLYNTLYLAPNGNNLQTAEIQTLQFNVATDGWFSLDTGGTASADILFDSTNPNGVANAIQAALDADFNDVQVAYIYDPLTTTFEFEVTFAGASAGADIDPVTLAAPQDANNTPALAGTMFSFEVVKGDNPPPPIIAEYSVGDEGTWQEEVSIGMEPDGDFVMVWTQRDRYTTLAESNTNVYFRTFNERTDTAGPMVTDLIAPSGESVDQAATIQGPLQHVVLTFDEELAQYDDDTIAWAIAERDLAIADGLPIDGTVAAILDSVTNVENYRLLRNGAEMPETIVRVEFGMSMAAELADTYGLNPIPSNKWEAVITFDANGIDPGVEPLSSGLYTIETLAPAPDMQAALSQSGIRDKSGVPLNHTGFAIGGLNVSRDFVVVVNNDNTDTPVTEIPQVAPGSNG
ncbi:MAG TPA: hypothetical protein VE890_16190, partial [Thermoguttaceae bacterium]|nr:hypothetical protein [Thermoguttaceae bacterium]